jgi:ATP-dependent RNA helicase DeaD
LKQALANALDAQGYTTLTAVQEAVSDPDLAGKDLLVSAQTGSGKTLGFGLAIAPALFGEAETFGPAAAPLALVIAPTRELALQVKRELAWLFGQANAVLASTVGGMDMRDERRALERGAHIVVATPGRLRDHIMRGSIDLSALKAVVLDEADEMLDLGFREDLEFILEQAPSERQTLLFSATVPAAIVKLASNYQKDAIRISTVSGSTQHADIEYRALTVSARDAENAIINVLRYYEAPNAIVFCNTRAMVNRLTTRLSNRNFSVVALSGELSQSERTHALQAMRDGRARVCVATDVAARGIDLPNLELVIHAELPTNQDTLLHRSGRTGRAGRKGVSALIVPPAARKKAQRLLGWAKVKAEWADAPSAEEVTARDDERMLAGTEWDAEIEESHRATIDKLTERFSAEQLAAAFVRLFRERHSAPEELSDVAAPAEPRAAFGPSVWFSIEGGRAAGAEPRRLLPMLCKIGALSREDIGAIRVQNDVSLVEIRQGAVQGFLASVGPAMTLEGGARLTRLDAAPAVADRGARPGQAAQTKVQASEKPAQKAPPRGEPPVTHGTTTPVDLNDAPKPRVKKPKPGSKPKPRRDDGAQAEAREERPGLSGLAKRKPLKGKGKPDAEGKGRGPKPPAGKPNSKKNRARQAAKAATATTAKPRKPRSKS